jgi:hypothetical protein
MYTRICFANACIYIPNISIQGWHMYTYTYIHMYMYIYIQVFVYMYCVYAHIYEGLRFTA